MKVFDFDNTIYFGESSVDFCFFMMKKDGRIIKKIPSILFTLLKYKLCLIKKDKIETLINRNLKIFYNKKDMDGYVREFWEINEYKLDNKILNIIDKEDVIITASPDFLIEGIKDKMNTKHFICTTIDKDLGKITNFNFNNNKVDNYKKIYGERRIDAFYTDSFNDKPLMELSNQVFMVKKGRIRVLKS